MKGRYAMEKVTLEFEVGTIEEWKEKDKEVYEKILERHRDTNVDHEWWKFTVEQFQEELEALGFATTDINFSGFWSQGDGASFTGDWDSAKMLTVKELKEKGFVLSDWAVELRRILKGNLKDIKAKYATFSIKRISHHYCHENTVDIFYAEYWNSRKQEQCYIPPEQEDDILEGCRTAMKAMYRILEKEYDYLTSDEGVEETLSDNEYKFDKEGKIWG
jgi:hypothetical protein